MIGIEHVTFAYPGSGKDVLADFNLNIEDGEFLCIIGHSGCGKSTLLRLAAGLDVPQGGKILVDGSPVAVSYTHLTKEAQRFIADRLIGILLEQL